MHAALQWVSAVAIAVAWAWTTRVMSHEARIARSAAFKDLVRSPAYVAAQIGNLCASIAFNAGLAVPGMLPFQAQPVTRALELAFTAALDGAKGARRRAQTCAGIALIVFGSTLIGST